MPERRLAAPALPLSVRVGPRADAGPRGFRPHFRYRPMSSIRRGFTLIELLIVVVIIGILAAIAIPKFQNTKGKANAASLKSDLRNLMTAEEAYFYQNSSYTSSLSALNASMTQGVVVTFSAAGATGWAAKVTHPQAYPIECFAFMGAAGPNGPATVEGTIACQ